MIARVQYLLIGVGLALITACTGPGNRPTSQSSLKATPVGVIDCTLVERMPSDSAETRELLDYLLPAILANNLSIAAYEPAFGEIRSLDRFQDWILLQASFTVALEPAIFVVQITPDGYHYHGVGWAGMAESVAQIRATLTSDFPDLPAELVACIELADWVVSR